MGSEYISSSNDIEADFRLLSRIAPLSVWAQDWRPPPDFTSALRRARDKSLNLKVWKSKSTRKLLIWQKFSLSQHIVNSPIWYYKLPYTVLICNDSWAVESWTCWQFQWRGANEKFKRKTNSVWECPKDKNIWEPAEKKVWIEMAKAPDWETGFLDAVMLGNIGSGYRAKICCRWTALR